MQTLVAVIRFTGLECDGTRRTLQSLARNGVTPDVRVALVPADDAARKALPSLSGGAAAGFEGAGGFFAALRDIAAAFPDRDVVWLAPGVELPFAWDARLAKAARAEPRIAASVPMCDASPLHRLVDEAHREAAVSQSDAIDRSAYCMGSRGYYEVPQMHAACAYLRREALAEALSATDLAPGDDATAALASLAQRWRASGWACVLCDFLYVGYAGHGPNAAPPLDLDASAFAAHHPLGGLRRALNDALDAGLPPVSTPCLDARPVQLHIMHFWGGGVDKWVRDFGRADTEHTNLILATYRIGERGGQRVVLYSDPDAKLPVHTWDISRPLLSTAVSSLEYRAILEQVVREYGVEAIIVSSLIGHSLDALRQPLKTIIVSHDFYPVCPNINPRFDETCAGCSAMELARCLPQSDFLEVFGDTKPADWDALRRAYVDAILERGIEMAVPTPSVAATLKRIEPRLAAVPMHVIGHGIDFAAVRLPEVPVVASQRLRLAVLGRLNPHKGADLLRAAAPALSTHCEVTLVGAGPMGVKLANELGWDSIESYDLEELPGLLRTLAPHAALLPSVVPETFSYTLSELWTLGIPPIATALGSFRDRISDGVDGFLFEPQAGALAALVEGLRAHPERLAAVARQLAGRRPERSTGDMVRDYSRFLPSGTRPVARFEVGIGRQTALTEPYRQLSEAYARLSEAYERVTSAYDQASDAYKHTKAEFDRTHAEYERARAELAVYESYGRELASLHVGKCWWLAPKAERLVDEMRRKIQAAERVEAPDAAKSNS